MTDATLQIVSDLTAEYLKLNLKPQVEVNEVRRGRVRPKTGKITIPKWALGKGEHFALAYVVHEVCHYLFMGHGPDFKACEMDALKPWGLFPIYARAYVKELRQGSVNGPTLYKRPARTTTQQIIKAFRTTPWPPLSDPINI